MFQCLMLKSACHESVMSDADWVPNNNRVSGLFYFKCHKDYFSVVFKVTPYSYLARGDWVLKWRERAQFS